MAIQKPTTADLSFTCPSCRSRVATEDFRFHCPCCGLAQQGTIYLATPTCHNCEYQLVHLPLPCCGCGLVSETILFRRFLDDDTLLPPRVDLVFPPRGPQPNGSVPVYLSLHGRANYDAELSWCQTRGAGDTMPSLSEIGRVLGSKDTPFPVPFESLVIQRMGVLDDGSIWVHCDVLKYERPGWHVDRMIGRLSAQVKVQSDGTLGLLRWHHAVDRMLGNERLNHTATSLRTLGQLAGEEDLYISPGRVTADSMGPNGVHLYRLMWCFKDIAFDTGFFGKMSVSVLSVEERLPHSSRLEVELYPRGRLSDSTPAGGGLATLTFVLQSSDHPCEVHATGTARSLPLARHTVHSPVECVTIDRFAAPQLEHQMFVAKFINNNKYGVDDVPSEVIAQHVDGEWPTIPVYVPNQVRMASAIAHNQRTSGPVPQNASSRLQTDQEGRPEQHSSQPERGRSIAKGTQANGNPSRGEADSRHTTMMDDLAERERQAKVEGAARQLAASRRMLWVAGLLSVGVAGALVYATNRNEEHRAAMGRTFSTETEPMTPFNPETGTCPVWMTQGPSMVVAIGSSDVTSRCDDTLSRCADTLPDSETTAAMAGHTLKPADMKRAEVARWVAQGTRAKQVVLLLDEGGKLVVSRLALDQPETFKAAGGCEN